jgi:hypothetical protein
MSSEPDYNFNQPAESTSGTDAIQLPFALLVLAIAVIMVAQTVNVFKAHSGLRDGLTKYNEAYTQRQPLVQQSVELQKKLESIVLDLLMLAKTDKEAEAIVSKYHIQQSAPAGAAAPAEPAPAK